LKRSRGWRTCFDPDTKFVFPKKRNGEWLHRKPLSGQGWIEANAWQATWSVSHDIPALTELMGGQDAFCDKLEEALQSAQSQDFVYGYGSGHVSYANQPGCSSAHVFNHAGKPWLAQYWVRQVNQQAYGAVTPDRGYGGHDEDQGQMGSISALMSLGLFSLRGGCASEPIYEITSPVFHRITFRLDPTYYSGDAFTVETRNNSTENCYIQSAQLNGKALDRAWIYHKEFAQGGLLTLTLGPAPNFEWGAAHSPP
jgi:putative alpha-1,2-mannosidase